LTYIEESITTGLPSKQNGLKNTRPNISISPDLHEKNMSVLVIGYNTYWTDTERKDKEKFWMYRLKSFRPQGIP
jgi:hypothetical protein